MSGFGTLVLAGLAAAGYAWSKWVGARHRDSWEALGRDLGLQVVASGEGELHLRGKVHGAQVRIHRRRVAEGEGASWRVMTRISRKPHRRVRVEPQPSFSVFPSARDAVATGHPEFDKRYLVRGPTALSLSLVDSATRSSLLQLDAADPVASRSVDLRQGLVAVDWIERDAPGVRAAVVGYAGVLGALAGDGEGIGPRLLEAVRHDPEPGARRAALRALRGDGPEAFVGAALDAAEQDDDRAVAMEARWGLAQRDLRRPWPSLLPLARSDEEAHREGLARLVGERRLTEGEGTLVRFLEDVAPVQRAAVEALGEIGRRETVELLLPLTRGVLRPPALKGAARQAIEAIQGRLPDAERGRVSVIEEAGGELSPVAGEGGVSLLDGGGLGTPGE